MKTASLVVLGALGACVAAPAAPATIDLGNLIAPGKWALAYQRTGMFKPLRLKKQEDGVSYTCLDADPRRRLHAWLAKKGCRVESERMNGEVYRLEGECTMKWWKSNPIPVQLDLYPEERRRFRLHIRTVGDSFLAFEENTVATHQGDCDEPR